MMHRRMSKVPKNLEHKIPLTKVDGVVTLRPCPDGAELCYAQSYDSVRGYRVALWFSTSEAVKSTINPSDLSVWVAACNSGGNEDSTEILRILAEQASLAQWQQDEWIRRGRPTSGVTDNEATRH